MYLEIFVNFPLGVKTQVCFDYIPARKEFNENCTIFDIEILGVEAFNEAGVKLDFVTMIFIQNTPVLREQLVKFAHEYEIEKRA